MSFGIVWPVTVIAMPEHRDRLLEHLHREAIVAKARGHRVPVRDQMMFTVLLAAGVRPAEIARASIRDLHLARDPRITITRLKRRKLVVEDVFLPGALKKPLLDDLEWMKNAGVSVEPTDPCSPAGTASA